MSRLFTGCAQVSMGILPRLGLGTEWSGGSLNSKLPECSKLIDLVACLHCKRGHNCATFKLTFGHISSCTHSEISTKNPSTGISSVNTWTPGNSGSEVCIR